MGTRRRGTGYFGKTGTVSPVAGAEGFRATTHSPLLKFAKSNTRADGFVCWHAADFVALPTRRNRDENVAPRVLAGGLLGHLVAGIRRSGSRGGLRQQPDVRHGGVPNRRNLHGRRVGRLLMRSDLRRQRAIL